MPISGKASFVASFDERNVINNQLLKINVGGKNLNQTIQFWNILGVEISKIISDSVFVDFRNILTPMSLRLVFKKRCSENNFTWLGHKDLVCIAFWCRDYEGSSLFGLTQLDKTHKIFLVCNTAGEMYEFLALMKNSIELTSSHA